jgi:hypothetical protein
MTPAEVHDRAVLVGFDGSRDAAAAIEIGALLFPAARASTSPSPPAGMQSR